VGIKTNPEAHQKKLPLASLRAAMVYWLAISVILSLPDETSGQLDVARRIAAAQTGNFTEPRAAVDGSARRGPDDVIRGIRDIGLKLQLPLLMDGKEPLDP